MEVTTPIQSYLDLNITSRPSVQDQHFFGHGKILLSAEYLIMDGALAIALPTKVGQALSVKYSPSFNPKLTWRSLDSTGRPWFEAQFEFWHFDVFQNGETEASPISKETLYLQNLLRQVRKQNTHFLRDEVDVFVETRLGFPIDWGLGSSSTLIYNVAQWAYISPFKLAFDMSTCSGYDIACAQSDGPILYRCDSSGPHWETISFEPPFMKNLYLVYTGKKRDTAHAVGEYREKRQDDSDNIERMNEITKMMLQCQSLPEFEMLIRQHEDLLAKRLLMNSVKETYFKDYWGEIKSLGAWGGDFLLATSDKNEDVTKAYFSQLGHDVFFRLQDIILQRGLAASQFPLQ
jgi:mevalonate kinase